MFFSAADIRQYTDFEKMLEIVFESPKYREIAQGILLRFKENNDRGGAGDKGLSGSEMAKLSQQYSKSTFYKVLNEVMIPLGILEKNPRTHRYYLSPEFANALRRFSEYWKKWMQD